MEKKERKKNDSPDVNIDLFGAIISNSHPTEQLWTYHLFTCGLNVQEYIAESIRIEREKEKKC